MRTVRHTRSLRDDTRRRILQAAGRIFADRGFDAATIKQITDAAKANVAAVNYHFGSKRRLYLEVLRLALPDIRQWPFHTIPGSGPKEELRSFISTVLSSMLGEDRPRWHSEVAVREIVSPTMRYRNWWTNISPPSPGIWRTSCANSVHVSRKQNRSDWLRRASWRYASIGLYSARLFTLRR